MTAVGRLMYAYAGLTFGIFVTYFSVLGIEIPLLLKLRIVSHFGEIIIIAFLAVTFGVYITGRRNN